MSVSRRDFMKMVGISVASLALTRCKLVPATCYVPMPPSPYPTEPEPAREVLKRCWMSFGSLAQATIDESNQNITDNVLGQQLTAEHKTALNELVDNGDLSPSVADLIQEAYEAAVFHVWRSNTMITCYEPMMVDYAPASAGVLVQQSEALSDIAKANSIDPEILEKARTALEHDMAYIALTDEEISSLYDRLVAEWQSQQQTVPSFGELELEITPDCKTAAQFIIDLLTK
jgi:hypothetical protein